MSACLGRITLAIEKMPCGREYKLRDLSLAEFGRQQIQLVESDMPGLMALRSEFGPSQPLKGTRITGCLHLTTQTAVLIETLTALGASVRWCSSSPYSTEDHAAAAVARDSASVFAWKGQSFQEYWWSVERALDWGKQGGPDLLIDDIGDAALFIHEGVRAEEERERGERKSCNPLSRNFENDRSRVMLQWIEESINENPRRFRKIKERLVGITEQTHSGVRRVHQLQSSGDLFFPTISVNDALTTKRIDNIHGVEQSFLASFMRAIDNIAIGGKHAIVLGFGGVGRGVARAFKNVGARVTVVEVNPHRALKALFEGFNVRRLEEVVSEADIFVTATGNIKVLTFQHFQQMKRNAIVCNMGSFEDEIDIEGLNNACVGAKSSFPRIEKVRAQGIDIQRFNNLHVYLESDKCIVVLAEGGELNFVSASGPPSFIRSCSFSNQVLALFELWNNKKSCKYDSRVYVLPRDLDEKVASLHLDRLGASLTKLTPEQASYLNVPIDGPFNTDDFSLQVLRD